MPNNGDPDKTGAKKKKDLKRPLTGPFFLPPSYLINHDKLRPPDELGVVFKFDVCAEVHPVPVFLVEVFLGIVVGAKLQSSKNEAFIPGP